MKTGNCYEKDGITIQIDEITDDEVYFAKYDSKIGKMAGMEQFMGYFRMDKKLFIKQIEGAVSND